MSQTHQPTALAVPYQPIEGAFSSRATISLSGIYEISKVLAEPARLEITLANVITILSSFLKMRRGAIIVLDGNGLPEITAAANYDREDRGSATVPQAVIDRIVATASPLVVQDVATSDLFSLDEEDEEDCPLSFIGVPVKADRKVLGTLTIDRRRDEATEFRHDEDMLFLTMVANLTGQTIRLHRILSEDRQRMIEQQRRLEKTLSSTAGAPPLRQGVPPGIVGDSAALKGVLETIRIVARTNSTVLLRGESGTGKELFSQTIHELSARRGKPSSSSIVRRCPKASWSRNSSAMRKVPLPARWDSASAGSRWRMAARFCSTRSARSRAPSRRNCCACCRRASSSGSAATRRSRSMCG